MTAQRDVASPPDSAECAACSCCASDFDLDLDFDDLDFDRRQRRRQLPVTSSIVGRRPSAAGGGAVCTRRRQMSLRRSIVSSRLVATLLNSIYNTTITYTAGALGYRKQSLYSTVLQTLLYLFNASLSVLYSVHCISVQQAFSMQFMHFYRATAKHTHGLAIDVCPSVKCVDCDKRDNCL